MFGRKKDISRKIFQIRYNIEIEIRILNNKTEIFHLTGERNKDLLKEIVRAQEKIQSYLHELQIIMEYDSEEIELLDEEPEFLDELTKEIEILDDTRFKTEILDDITEQIAIIDKKEELDELELLQDTMNIPIKSITDSISNTEILDDEFNEYLKNHKELSESIDASKKQIDDRIKKIRLKKRIWTCLFSISIICLIALLSIIGFRIYNTVYNDRQIKNLDKYIIDSEKEADLDDIGNVISVSDNILDEENVDNDDKNIDFDALISKNESTRGWLIVNGTNINYPFVQADNNKYYLSHTFDKSWNYRGWLFLDYRNNFESNDMNTIIYGHGLLDNTMMGSLKKVVKEEWYKNRDNHVITIHTPNGYRLYQVFSTYTIVPENYYITPNFSNNEDYREFLDTLISRSVYDYDVNLNVSDKILTLSSCYDDDYRVVLHAKLIYKSY